jgi:hypothetical protein
MKGLVPYILFVAWFGYVLAGMQSFASVAENVVEKSSCHKTEEKAEMSGDCCAKMHKDQAEQKKPCASNEGEKDDCCHSSNCPRTCCHVAISILPAQENPEHIELFFTQSFPTPHTDQLPEPYIGKISPPPNV